MISRRALLSGLPLLASCRRQPGTGYAGFAYVALAEEPAVAVVDLLAFLTRMRIRLESAPSTVLTHPAAPGMVYAAAGASLVEIDSKSHSPRRSARLPGEPLRVLAEPGSKRFRIIVRNSPQLLSVDLDSFKPGRGLPLAAPPVAIDISSQASLLCAALLDGSVQFVDLAAGRARPAVKLGSPLGSVLFRSDAKLVSATRPDARQLTFIDVESGSVVADLPLALRPERLCVSADGGQLFLTGEGRDAVVIVYPYRTEIAQTSLTGRKPGAMAVSAGPDYLFVANPQANSVTVFDIATQKVLAVTGVGMNPAAIVITEDQQYALVLNRGSGDMAVIRIAAITPGRGKSAPLFTMIPVGSAPVSAVVVPRAQ